MHFATVRDRRTGWQKLRGQHGGRGYFFDFEYDVTRDPTEERVALAAGPELHKWGVGWLWPDVAASVAAAGRALEEKGVRLCSTRLVITAAKHHPIDTDGEAIRRNVGRFLEECPRTWAAPVEPFPGPWLTPTVVNLARGIRTDAALDRLPILADALQDAGCSDPLVIDHLQSCPDHGASCWVVEMILDRLTAR